MKLVLRLFNIVYIALAAVACVALFTKPIVSINAGISLNKEQVTNLVYDSIKQDVSQEDFDKALNKSLDESGKFSIGLKLEVPATSLLTKDAKAITSGLTDQVGDTIQQIVDKLSPTIEELAKIVAKKAGREAIKDSIENQINSTNPGQGEQIIADCNLEEDIDKLTNEVFDMLLPEDGGEQVATVAELMDGIEDNIYDVCEKLADAGVPGYPSDPVELKEKVDQMNENIETQLQDALQKANLCDEDGNITDVEKAIDSFLADMLDKIINGESTDEHTEKGMVMRAGSQEEEESKLRAKIKELLNKKVADLHIDTTVDKYWFVPLIFTCVLILPWLVFIVITLIRTLRKNKVWTKSWVVFSFAFVQVVLGIVLYLATAKFMSQLVNMIPLPSNPAVDILKSSSLVVQTSSYIPSILYLVMIPLSIVYVILAHKVKKDYKNGKAEKKSA